MDNKCEDMCGTGALSRGAQQQWEGRGQMSRERGTNGRVVKGDISRWECISRWEWDGGSQQPSHPKGCFITRGEDNNQDNHHRSDSQRRVQSSPTFPNVMFPLETTIRESLGKILERICFQFLSLCLVLSKLVLVISVRSLSFGLMSLEGVQCFDWKSHFYSEDDLNEHGGGFDYSRKKRQETLTVFHIPHPSLPLPTDPSILGRLKDRESFSAGIWKHSSFSVYTVSHRWVMDFKQATVCQSIGQRPDLNLNCTDRTFSLESK